ncbi:MAG TPA: lysylphosphatidylglycerol synthase domain-containing protein [Nevskiaceae bacterium]|nr:lysylphosphatidylglycerol synthase domain-containing protein [Nevskiaceae bacterium]
MPRKLKLFLGPLILLITIVVFARYLSQHTYLLTQLSHTPLLTVLGLLALYAVWFFALVLVLRFSLYIYQKNMSAQENFLLNAYSSLVNFFGPGQSGPAVRGAYLKKRHGLRLRDYTFATLLYYAFYAVISAFLLFVGSRPWWQTLAVVALVGGGSYVALHWFGKRSRSEQDRQGLTMTHLGLILAATALQAVAQIAIYYVELHNVNPHVSLAQAVTYTGAANFALFVALTPGAIGIRESFLLFTQQLHHIGSANIVAANLIDRAVYIAFLGLLFVLIVTLHAKDKLHIK